MVGAEGSITNSIIDLIWRI